MKVLMVVGIAIELVGLGLTAWGLYRAWKVSAGGERLLHARVHAAYWRVARLWGGRPSPRVVQVGASDEAHVSDSAILQVTRSSAASLDERVDRLERDVDALRDATDRLAQADRDIRSELVATTRELRSAIEGVRTTVQRKLTDDAVYQLRPAIVGLGVAGVGLLLQGIATLLG